MSPPELRILNPDEFPLWDNLVEITPNATYFQRSEWLNSTSRILGVKPRIYGYFIDDALVGGCSLHLQSLWPGIVSASSVSECSPHGGLVVDLSHEKSFLHSERRLHALMKALLEAFKQDGFDQVIIQNPPGLNDIRIFNWNNWRCRVLYTYRLSTSQPSYSRTARKHIALAIRQGVVVERSWEIGVFTELLKAMYASKGVNPFYDIDRLRPIFEALVRSGDGEIWLARDSDGTVFSADLIISDSKQAYRWSAASRPERKLYGSVFLQLATIVESLQSRSIPTFVMMTANVPELAEFTAKFNPELVPYFHSEFRSKRFRWHKNTRGLLSICKSMG